MTLSLIDLIGKAMFYVDGNLLKQFRDKECFDNSYKVAIIIEIIIIVNRFKNLLFYRSRYA